jgi:hypothetical protein
LIYWQSISASSFGFFDAIQPDLLADMMLKCSFLSMGHALAVLMISAVKCNAIVSRKVAGMQCRQMKLGCNKMDNAPGNCVSHCYCGKVYSIVPGSSSTQTPLP